MYQHIALVAEQKMSEKDYNWLFMDSGQQSQDDDSNSSDVDMEDVQNYLYSMIHYEADDSTTGNAINVVPGDNSYSMELEEEAVAEKESSATFTEIHYHDVDTSEISSSDVESCDEVCWKRKSKSGFSSSTPKPASWDAAGITHFLERTVSNTSQTVKVKVASSKETGVPSPRKECIVVNSLSDDSDSDVIIVSPPKKSKVSEKKNTTGSEKVSNKVVTIHSSSSESSDSDESYTGDLKASSSGLNDIKIHMHSAGRTVVVDCDQLDISGEIEMDTTLDDIHASLQECDWSLNINDRQVTKSVLNRYYTPITVRCHNCEQVGHLSKVCPLPKKKQCCLCGATGHDQWKCPDKLCHNCYRTGHENKDCDEPRRRRHNDVCKRCEMCGHRQFVEPGRPVKGSGEDNDRVYCYNCAGRGHWGFECEETKMNQYINFTCPIISRYDVTEMAIIKNPGRKAEKRSWKDHSTGSSSEDGHKRNKVGVDTARNLRSKLSAKYKNINKSDKSKKLKEKVSAEDIADLRLKLKHDLSKAKTVRITKSAKMKIEFKNGELLPGTSEPIRGQDGAVDYTHSSGKNIKTTNSQAKSIALDTKLKNEKANSEAETASLDPGSRLSLISLLMNKKKGNISKKGEKKLALLAARAKAIGQYDTLVREAEKQQQVAAKKKAKKAGKLGTGVDAILNNGKSGDKKDESEGKGKNTEQKSLDKQSFVAADGKHWRTNTNGFRFGWVTWDLKH